MTGSFYLYALETTTVADELVMVEPDARSLTLKLTWSDYSPLGKRAFLLFYSPKDESSRLYRPKYDQKTQTSVIQHR